MNVMKENGGNENWIFKYRMCKYMSYGFVIPPAGRGMDTWPRPA